MPDNASAKLRFAAFEQPSDIEMSQTELSKRLGYCIPYRQTVNLWCSGKRFPPMLIVGGLANALPFDALAYVLGVEGVGHAWSPRMASMRIMMSFSMTS